MGGFFVGWPLSVLVVEYNGGFSSHWSWLKSGQEFMLYLVFLFMLGLLLGLVVVGSNPSPYFAALGLVVVSGMGCGLIMVCGGTFLSLILFLIYLGGMLVVFAYSSALASEPHPET